MINFRWKMENGFFSNASMLDEGSSSIQHPASSTQHPASFLLACYAKLGHNIFSADEKTNLEVFKRSKLEGAQGQVSSLRREFIYVI
jgi:hypothetical protein